MVRWVQAAGLAVVLALGESCGLKSVPVPRLEAGQPPASAATVSDLFAQLQPDPAGEAASSSAEARAAWTSGLSASVVSIASRVLE